MPAEAGFARAYGLARSLVTYYGQPWRTARRRAFYGQFLSPGDLAFDVGAHVGDRIRTFRSLGARILAVEPQPDFARVLRWLYGRDEQVTRLAICIGKERGVGTLQVSSRTPTVSTLSHAWIDEVRQDARFSRIVWDRSIEVKIETLDALIERYGEPAFIKIDVEGMERDVLEGLHRPVRALSFEYIPMLRGRSKSCVDRVAELGPYRFRHSAVETTRWSAARWLDAAEMKRVLDEMPDTAGSGDIYAIREGERATRSTNEM